MPSNNAAWSKNKVDLEASRWGTEALHYWWFIPPSERAEVHCTAPALKNRARVSLIIDDSLSVWNSLTLQPHTLLSCSLYQFLFTARIVCSMHREPDCSVVNVYLLVYIRMNHAPVPGSIKTLKETLPGGSFSSSRVYLISLHFAHYFSSCLVSLYRGCGAPGEWTLVQRQTHAPGLRGEISRRGHQKLRWLYWLYLFLSR